MRYLSYIGMNRITLVALLCVAALIRFVHLDGPSLWRDEFITLGVARLNTSDLLITLFDALRQNGAAAPLTPPTLLGIPREFGAFATPGNRAAWVFLAVPAAFGLWTGLRRHTRMSFILLACWAFVPLVTFLLAGTSLEISSRYLFSLDYFLLICAALGTDGRAFEIVGRLGSDGSNLWKGLKVRRVYAKHFRKPAHDLLIRFELSGDGAQIWSPPMQPMRIEAVLDCRILPPWGAEHSARV